MSLKLEPKPGFGIGTDAVTQLSPAQVSGSSRTRAPRLPHVRLSGFSSTYLRGDRSPAGVLFSIMAYSFCSSTMLVVNKVVVSHVRVPTAVRHVRRCGLLCVAR